MSLSFGTDGLRGVANRELTPEAVLALGRAAARVLGRGTWTIGRDTRRSGPMLAAALAAGLAAEGADVLDAGVLPTPGVAHLCQRRGGPGAVVSASHNPFTDNGVKLFAVGGRKLDDATEAAVERLLDGYRSARRSSDRPEEGAEGTVRADNDARRSYLEHLGAVLGGRRLDGMRVVADCANGAASSLAGPALESLGVRVDVLHADPDGTNINRDCGSTHPEALQRAVRERGADAGVAFDGDADRVIAVDEAGRLVDGDHLLALFALDLERRGALVGDTVVVTVMTNLGFHQAMAEHGIRVVETPVGDRNVLTAMESGGYVLGGEQSGHLVFADAATTGDGLLTAIRLLDVVNRARRPLGELALAAMTRLPQTLRNVRVADRDGLEAAGAVWDAVDVVTEELAGRGRVVLRPSGTEPVVRVMVEAPTQEDADRAVDHLAAVVLDALGAPVDG